jgi:hypothetical protein
MPPTASRDAVIIRARLILRPAWSVVGEIAHEAGGG